MIFLMNNSKNTVSHTPSLFFPKKETISQLIKKSLVGVFLGTSLMTAAQTPKKVISSSSQNKIEVQDTTNYEKIYEEWINKDLTTINFDTLSEKEKMEINKNITIAIMMEVNKYRTHKLKLDSRLIQSAKKRSDYMIKNDYEKNIKLKNWHQKIDGSWRFTSEMTEGTDYDPIGIAEVITHGFNTPLTIFNNFKGSLFHWQSLTDENKNDIGFWYNKGYTVGTISKERSK